MAPATTESILKVARNANIKLPKSKKVCLQEIESALSVAGGDDSTKEGSGPSNHKGVLKILKAKFGRKEEPKPNPEKQTGKRKADTPVAAEGKVDVKPATVSASVLAEAWDVSDKPKRNACGAKLVDVAKARGVKMPEDERAARMGAFSAVMAVKDETASVNVKDAIEFLQDKFGKDPNWVDPDSKAPKKKKVSKAKPCTCPENTDLAEAFDELAGLYFKEQSKAGFVYKKIVTAIKDLPEPLLAAPKKGEIKGVGAKSIAKIKEFLDTGKIQELEDKRADSVA